MEKYISLPEELVKAQIQTILSYIIPKITQFNKWNYQIKIFLILVEGIQV